MQGNACIAKRGGSIYLQRNTVELLIIGPATPTTNLREELGAVGRRKPMSEQSVIDFDAAVSLKAHGQEMTAWANLTFVETMREEARRICERVGHVSIDDLRVRAQQLGIAPHSKQAWGSIFGEKGWRIVKYARSGVVTNRARVIGIWKWEP